MLNTKNCSFPFTFHRSGIWTLSRAQKLGQRFSYEGLQIALKEQMRLMCIQFEIKGTISIRSHRFVLFPCLYHIRRLRLSFSGMKCVIGVIGLLPSHSLCLDQECSTDWNREGNKLNTVHLSTMHAKTIQPV